MSLFNKRFILYFILFYFVLLALKANAQCQHCEKSYQYAWCAINNGIAEYKNNDLTRIDCLTKTHAVEFDFAKKWAESVGQALYYGVMTGKKAKVVLIIGEPKEMKYYKRVEKLSKIYNFDIEYVTDDILKLSKNGECGYSKCKCHKVN